MKKRDERIVEKISESFHEQVENQKKLRDEGNKKIFEYLEEQEKRIDRLEKNNGKGKKLSFFKKNENIERYRIKIVYEKNPEMADNLRIALGQKGNNTWIEAYEDFRYGRSEKTAEYIVICENLDNGVSKKEKYIFNKYGCKIAEIGNQLIILNDPDAVTDRDGFVKFYKEIFDEQDQKTEAMIQALKDGTDDTLDPQKVNLIIDEIEKNRVRSFEKMSNIPKALEYLFRGAINSWSTALILACAPVGISEILYNATIKKLKSKILDKNNVDQAQKQILIIELCQYFEHKQFGI